MCAQVCYVMGKRLREAAYRIWEAHKNTEVMGSKAATIMTIRQFACIDVGCTMPQAERYVRLVRYVERGGAAGSWERVDELVERYPRGLMQVRLACGTAVARSPPQAASAYTYARHRVLAGAGRCGGRE